MSRLNSTRVEDKSRDEWLCSLWSKITGPNGHRLDRQGARSGFERLGNPLLKSKGAIDSVILLLFSGDRDDICFQDFARFVSSSERALWSYFQLLDHDGDGHLNLTDLSKTLGEAGISLSDEHIHRIHGRLDVDQDGVISFQDWRTLLVFAPSVSSNMRSLIRFLATLDQTSSFSSSSASPSSMVTSPKADPASSGPSTLQALFGSLYLVFHSLVPPPFDSHPPPSSALSSPSSSEKYAPSKSATTSTALTPAPASISGTSLTSQRVPIDALASVTREAIPVERQLSLWSTVTALTAACVPNPGYFIAGGVAGMVSRTVTAPLDRLKVYLIAQTTRKSASKMQYATVGEKIRGRLKPMADATRELWAAGGVRSLFAGNGLNVVKIMPESAIKFGSYEATKRVLAQLQGLEDPMELTSSFRFLAGGISGIFAQIAVYPIDTLKFRMQCEIVPGGLRGNKLIFSTLAKMWSTGGALSFYRGLPMGVVGIFPYAAIDLGTFEYLKRLVATRRARRLGCSVAEAAPGSFATAIMGGLSGAIGACSVYPLNVLRTRLQSQGTAMHARTYTGAWDVTVQTYKGEGVKGFYRGLTPNLLKVVPAISITYVVYEKTKRILELQ